MREQQRDTADRTPLHVLGWERADEKAAVLLEAGADPNAVDAYYKRPLDYLRGFINAGLALCEAGGRTFGGGPQACDFRGIGPELSGEQSEEPPGEGQ